MTVAVKMARIVCRRRLFTIRDASQPWNWYVTADTMSTKAARSKSGIRNAGPREKTSPRHMPASGGMNSSNVTLNSELR